MNILKKIYCRIYQTCFKLAIPLLPYRSPKIIELENLNNILSKENIKKLFIITDNNLIKLINPILNCLNINYFVYDKVKPNPTINDVEAARISYLDNNCEGILAIGGGSVIDLAKICGARVVKPKKSIQKMEGLLHICKKLPPLIVIPTTAGTGSETTLAAVITDEVNNHKYPINDFSLIPNYTIFIPELIMDLPSPITSTTGMDALTHAIEAFIGRSTTKKTRYYAIKAVKLIVENLKETYDNPHNLKARTNMLYAAHYAGIAFTISYVGYIHAIAHSLGGKYKTPHGLANAIILPIMLEIYGKKVYKKLAFLARETNIADDTDDNAVASKKFINYIYNLNKEMNIPNKLKDIKDEDIPLMAFYANKEANPLYPVPLLLDKNELENIYYIIRGQNE